MAQPPFDNLGIRCFVFGNGDDDRIVIGAKSFSEQYVLARLIGQRLEANGYTVTYRDGLGSAVAHRAVSTGAVDIMVDYTGTIWANEMQRSDNPDRDAMLADPHDRFYTFWGAASWYRTAPGRGELPSSSLAGGSAAGKTTSGSAATSA